MEENRPNSVDAFKELQARMPDVELMNIEQLQAMVFWAGSAVKWTRMQIDTAKNIPGMQAQIDAWIREGQTVGELELRGQQQLGKLAKETKQVQAPIPSGHRSSGGGVRRASGEPPKWQRLGFKSLQAMETANFISEHPAEVKEVIEEAKSEGDLPSKGAVRAKVRQRRAEEALAEAKKEAVKERVHAEPRRMARYFEAVKVYGSELEIAIEAAKQKSFSPESIHLLKKKHEALRGLMEKLEAAVK